MSKPPVPLDDRPRSGPYSGLNAKSARRFLCKQFEQAGLADCEGEARDLVMAATGLSRSELLTRGTDFISPEAFDRLQDYSARRLLGEPVDHILGWREFYGRRFDVSKEVLSPRQETEEVVAKALLMIKSQTAPRLLDLGTGSGAIILTLLAEHADATGVAIDVSEAALDIARINAQALELSRRVDFHQSHWFEAVQGTFDLIISNPPYIDSDAMADLPREVVDYDPHISLHGGTDGLEPYRIIARGAKAYLKAGAALVFEIGYDQGETVPQILQNEGYTDVVMSCDLAGQARIVSCRLERTYIET